jgi:hypothetical protein
MLIVPPDIVGMVNVRNRFVEMASLTRAKSATMEIYIDSTAVCPIVSLRAVNFALAHAAAKERALRHQGIS